MIAERRRTPPNTPPMTVTGAAMCTGTFTSPYPLADKVFMGTLTSQVSSSSALVADVTVPNPAGAIKWAWSLAPEG